MSHNLPESDNVAKELRVVATGTEAVLKAACPKVHVQVLAKEVGTTTFELRYVETLTPILCWLIRYSAVLRREIDCVGHEKSVLRILIEQALAARAEEICVMQLNADFRAHDLPRFPRHSLHCLSRSPYTFAIPTSGNHRCRPGP